jgi:uncharacterized membrane protein
MTIFTRVQNTIAEFEFFDDLAESCDQYLRENPRLHKVILMLNHLFRTLVMSAMLQIPGALLFCVAGSLIYRITVEKNCAFKFTLPALAGSLALEAFGTTFISAIPLILHSIYVYLTVDYEVDHLCCCNSNGS